MNAAIEDFSILFLLIDLLFTYEIHNSTLTEICNINEYIKNRKRNDNAKIKKNRTK